MNKDLTPLKESAVNSGRGGYGFDFSPRSKNTATIQKDTLPNVLGGSKNLSFDDMQKILARLVIDD